MFVVQNKQTGLYWRNTSGLGGWRRDEGWTADLQDVKPLRTMAAVRNLFYSVGSVIYTFNKRRWDKDPKLPKCCMELKWSTRSGVTNQCSHYKAAVEAKRQKARNTYRVFKVVLLLQDEQEL